MLYDNKRFSSTPPPSLPNQLDGMMNTYYSNKYRRVSNYRVSGTPVLELRLCEEGAMWGIVYHIDTGGGYLYFQECFSFYNLLIF